MNEVFVHDQLVRFAHCDPAAIVYFPRFFDMAHTVMEDWFAQGVGLSMPDMIRNRRIGTPTVTIQCDFVKALRMGEMLRFELRVTKIGRSSIQLDYRGLHDGELHLHIVQTIAFADLDAMQSVPIPEDIRGRVEAYRVG